MTMNIDVSNGAWEALQRRTSELRDVPLTGIRIDHRFQRALNPHAVAKIKGEYHPKGVGQVVLAGVEPENPSEAQLACIDGQTRVVALRDLAQEIAEGRRQVNGFVATVPAEVFPDLTVEEAALLFRLRNQQRPVPPKDRDRIGVTEGDPTMRAVVQQAADAGYVVFDDDPEKVTMPYLTEAKSIIRWDKSQEIPGLLTRALTIQARAFEAPEGGLVGSVDPKVLMATAKLLLKNPQLVEDEMIRVMAAVGLPALQQRARTKADVEGKRLEGAARTILVDLYNRGKRGADRIDR